MMRWLERRRMMIYMRWYKLRQHPPAYLPREKMCTCVRILKFVHELRIFLPSLKVECKCYYYLFSFFAPCMKNTTWKFDYQRCKRKISHFSWLNLHIYMKILPSHIYYNIYTYYVNVPRVRVFSFRVMMMKPTTILSLLISCPDFFASD